MSSKLRTSNLALAVLSLCFSISILGCAGRSLAIYHSQQSHNVWLLPIWPSHFDLRGLQASIGIYAATVVLNIVLLAALLAHKMPRPRIVNLASATCSASLVLIGLIFQAVLNNQSPRKDTLQTWSCHWESSWFKSHSRPKSFESLCEETKFAYYGSIPLFILQIALLGLSIHSVWNQRPTSNFVDLEKKGQELDNWQDDSRTERLVVQTKS